MKLGTNPGGDAPVVIIGGGGTGAALAWDLSLRGVPCLLLERGEFTSGTTGRHHGQLHSGARYAVKDEAIARECMEESRLLRKLVPDAVEYNGGIFVAITGAEADYADVFVAACLRAGIPARELSPDEARAAEPAINPRAKRCVWVPDGSFDAWRVPLSFLAGARAAGAELVNFATVTEIEGAGGTVRAVRYREARGGRELRRECAAIVSATGAWAGKTAALAGIRLDVTPAPGAMVAVRGRACDMVVSRMAPPGDGDIVVPQRGLSIIGSTQRPGADPDGILPLPEERDFLLARADELLPGFSSRAVHAAWAAARPLAGTGRGTGDDVPGRSLSRDFVVVDHASDGLAGFYSLVGGKATVLRAMAERAADAVCARLGIREPCRTRELAPPSWRRWYAGGTA